MDELADKQSAKVIVKWKPLKPDIILIIVAIAFPLISFAIDFRNNHSDWFFRSGAVTTIIGIVLAYRSLKKHYQKFPTDLARKEALASTIPQLRVDGWTMVLSIIGTLIWSYGDKFFELFLK